MELKPIAHIKTDFPEKFGIPRQSGRVPELKGKIIFEKEFRDPDFTRGIEEFSHLWLIWEFSDSEKDKVSPTVRPPRLGGNVRVGVFATRSPFRPNPIGLSCVKLEKIEEDEKLGRILTVGGIDMKDGTPIYDIKPYLPYADCHPEATGGFAEEKRHYALTVDFPAALEAQIDPAHRAALRGVLAHDPRPSYQSDPERMYGVAFAGKNVKFTVEDGVLTVRKIEEIS